MCTINSTIFQCMMDNLLKDGEKNGDKTIVLLRKDAKNEIEIRGSFRTIEKKCILSIRQSQLKFSEEIIIKENV